MGYAAQQKPHCPAHLLSAAPVDISVTGPNLIPVQVWSITKRLNQLKNVVQQVPCRQCCGQLSGAVKQLLIAVI